MKPGSYLLAAALTLAACAPARAPIEGPTDVPPPPAEAPAEPADAASDAGATAPDDWWLLDARADGVRGTSVELAYAELLAGKEPQRTVVVAVIDGGVDIEHQDLDANLWVNEDEVPGNGEDDDGNGYADDVHGWNFIGGPDGRQVHHDTYEVTRLYARYSGRYADADPDTLTGDARAEYDRFQEVAAAYETERQETEQMLQQIRTMDVAVDRFTALLRQHLGTDSLTVERVRAIQPTGAQLSQARQVYLQLAANGITPAMIDEELERLESLEEFGLNPSYDPRPIVGDDYDDPTQRRYGNGDVEGPDAFHGTHVAGIIGAERGNGIGVDGIAPAVRIMAVRAVPDGDERDKDVANAIRYAADNGADIINMSFGKGFSPQKEAVDAAVRYAEEKGVLLIHAAGNDGANIDVEPNFPNRYFLDGDTARNWIEVGASSWEGADQLAAPFSNYGDEHVDVFAPGVAIVSTVPDDGYQPASGTSMAAPVVSGLAALIMAYYPELDAGDVKRIILESATRYADQTVTRPGDDGGPVPFGQLSATGGVVNAYAALRLAEQMAGR